MHAGFKNGFMTTLGAITAVIAVNAIAKKLGYGLVEINIKKNENN